MSSGFNAFSTLRPCHGLLTFIGEALGGARW